MRHKDLWVAALALPEDERAALRDALEASIQVELEPELLASIKERSDELARGVPGVPKDEALGRLRRR